MLYIGIPELLWLFEKVDKKYVIKIPLNIVHVSPVSSVLFLVVGQYIYFLK